MAFSTLCPPKTPALLPMAIHLLGVKTSTGQPDSYFRTKLKQTENLVDSQRTVVDHLRHIVQSTRTCSSIA